MSSTAVAPKPAAKKPAAKKPAKRGANLAGPKRQNDERGQAARAAELERARGLRGAAQVDPTDDAQAERARLYVEEGSHAGLAGKALMEWIVSGDGLAAQTNGPKAQLAKAAARSSERKARAAKKPAAATSSKPAASKPAAGMSAKDAAEKVIREADGPMHWKAIADAVISGRLAPRLQGSTPEQTISAMLTVDANRGGRFVKTEPGTFDVRELNPRGAKKRPAKKSS